MPKKLKKQMSRPINMTFPLDVIATMDLRVRELGMSGRSEYIRSLIREDEWNAKRRRKTKRKGEQLA